MYGVYYAIVMPLELGVCIYIIIQKENNPVQKFSDEEPQILSRMVRLWNQFYPIYNDKKKENNILLTVTENLEISVREKH